MNARINHVRMEEPVQTSSVGTAAAAQQDGPEATASKVSTKHLMTGLTGREP